MAALRQHFLILLLFICSLINGPLDAQEKTSNILRSTMADSALLNVTIKSGFYDHQKGGLPYFNVSKPTAYSQSADAKLIVKKTEVVAEPHASVIRQKFSAFLTGNFELVPVASLSANQNLNNHLLYPFRINGNGQVEELVSYDITWQVQSNDFARARRAASNFKTASVLASGTWYKIGVTQTGLHKISAGFLASMGINTSNLDPRNIRIYGNGGQMLPEQNGAFRHDDLVENAIVVVGEEDGRLDNNDQVLFYATGTARWQRTHNPGALKFGATSNLYSDTSFYFISVDQGAGRRATHRASLSVQPTTVTNTYDYYNYHEQNIVNLGKSGREFYGEYFDVNTSYRFAWSDGDFVVGDTIIAEVSLVANYPEPSHYRVTGNNVDFGITTSYITPGTYADFAAPGVNRQAALNSNGTEIAITITREPPKSIGWLDKVTVNARRFLRLGAKQLQFRDSRVAAPGTICKYTIQNPALSAVRIWNITNPLDPYLQDFIQNDVSIEFTAGSDSLNEYCITPENDYHTPTFTGKVANQNLHALQQADYVIVTHPLFLGEANRLGKFHQTQDGLTYAVATTDQVYNEFSSGRQDIAAIRDFVRMLYSRNIDAGRQVRYLLLLGDGSYNNKSRSLVNNSNLVPTYQSLNSLSSTASIATDDFYALMDADEGFNAENNGSVDLGTGRFTCRTLSEVRGVVDKIEHYYAKDPDFQAKSTTAENCNNLNESPMGDWRNWLLFIGDDDDGALHMEQSNNLAEMTQDWDANYNLDKIYLDAYQRFSTPGGSRYPDAAADLVKRVKKGTLIFNYTGHGGEVGLTAERMVDLEIINNFDNYNKLTLFITATCEFSRYDDPARTSAGELCLILPKGGAISLLTTCRIAFAIENFTLNKKLLEYLFNKMPDGTRPRLGDVIMKTKASLKQNYTYANFHLLGDPALTLAYPQYQVNTSKINSVPITVSSSDTLAALAKVTINGFVSDTLGNKLTGFNGLVYPTVFDKEQMVSCLVNTPDAAWINGQPFVFPLQKNMLYRGKSTVTNGEFSFTFIVPKDVSFAAGRGRISYYATDGLVDAAGNYSNVIVGGDSKNIIVDNDGPQVNLYFNDKNFVPGGLVNEKPVLYADLADSSGINTVGTGLGHDISVMLDGDDKGAAPLVLNDFYEANLNSYQSGRVRYPFDKLSEGEHRLSFKVWDIQNNSNTVYTDFIVANSAELALDHVLNYPNPFTTRTKFMFQHNQACNPLKVTIQVYTVTGKLVKTIERSVLCEGYRPEGIEWDGRDDFGDKLGRGIYIYKLAVLDINNKKAEKIEKLVILN